MATIIPAARPSGGSRLCYEPNRPKQPAQVKLRLLLIIIIMIIIVMIIIVMIIIVMIIIVKPK